MVNPQIWGGAAWKFLFSTVAYYPDNPGIDMQHHFKRYFYHLRWVLPCELCGDNYDHHFRKWPIDSYLRSRPALFRWLANVFNETRRDQGKEPLSDHQIVYKFFGECGKGVPEQMIALLCSARVAREPALVQEGGGLLSLSLPEVNPTLLIAIVLLLLGYWYIFTRSRN